MINLNELVIEEAISAVVFDKEHGVSVMLKYIPRSEVQKIMNRNTRQEFNKKTHRMEEIFDNEKLSKDLAKTVVKGWKGVTYRYLSTIVVIDVKKIKNLDEEIAFNEANLNFLLEKSYDFGPWIIDSVRDASNFSEKNEAEVKN